MQVTGESSSNPAYQNPNIQAVVALQCYQLKAWGFPTAPSCYVSWGTPQPWKATRSSAWLLTLKYHL